MVTSWALVSLHTKILSFPFLCISRVFWYFWFLIVIVQFCWIYIQLSKITFALSWLLGKGEEYWKEENMIEEMPACRQMLNIFHPFDPVAYRSVFFIFILFLSLSLSKPHIKYYCLPCRLEPLVCKEFIQKPPVIIPYHRGGKRLYVVFKVRALLSLIFCGLNALYIIVLILCHIGI